MNTSPPAYAGRVVARWGTSGSRPTMITLFCGEQGYFYIENNGGGTIEAATDAEALAAMERPWGKTGAGPVTVLREDRPSMKRFA